MSLSSARYDEENGVLTSEIISSQQRVVQIQSELLTSKTEQLKSLQTTVKTSAEDSVNSYSAAVQCCRQAGA